MGLLDQILVQCSPGRTGRGEGRWVRLGVGRHLSDLGEGVPQSVDDVLVLGGDGLGRGLGEDRGDQGARGLGLGRPQLGGDGAGEVDAAALPGRPGQDGPDRGADAGVGVTGDQDHALGVVG